MKAAHVTLRRLSLIVDQADHQIRALNTSREYAKEDQNTQRCKDLTVQIKRTEDRIAPARDALLALSIAIGKGLL